MVITEEDFKVPSESARQAVRIATQLVEWAAKSDGNITEFFITLMAKLRKCFVERKSMKAREECMWRDYHKLRVSDEFKKVWEKFLRETISHQLFFSMLLTDFQGVGERKTQDNQKSRRSGQSNMS